MVADECFEPIVNEELYIFEALNEEASVEIHYTDEITAIDMLLKDSIRLAITARDLTEKEKEVIRSRKLVPRTQKIATDAIALIINKENNDSLMSMSTLKKIMTGEITSWKQINPDSKYDKIAVYFDNPRSSTVRYIHDSICTDKPMYDGLMAQKSNQEVLDKVSNTPNALGVIGVNWISSPTDTTYNQFTEKVRVVSVSKQDVATADNSYKPFPAFLALNEYPLTRNMYAVLIDLRGTLPAGIVHFMAGDRGQRIVLKAGLLPAVSPMRVISVKESF